MLFMSWYVPDQAWCEFVCCHYEGSMVHVHVLCVSEECGEDGAIEG